jgi:hypothetical protein
MSIRGIDARQQEEARRRSQRCVDEALASASRLAAVSLALSSAFVYGLNRWSPAFRNKFNASVKAAFTVMPAFFSFYLESEQAVYRCHSRAAGAEGGNAHMNHAKLRAMRLREQREREQGGGGGAGVAAAGTSGS